MSINLTDKLKTHILTITLLLCGHIGVLSAAAATLSAPVPCLQDNCLQYQLTTRDGLTIYLREWLQPDNGSPALSRQHPHSTQAMLMMPGFPHSAMLVWDRQVNDKNLALHYRMVTMEVRGHGDSSKDLNPSGADTTSEKHADDIADAIALLGLHKPVLMSHSFSGCRISDYLDYYGDSALGGLILTASFTKHDLTNPAFSEEVLDPNVSPALLGLADDLGDFYRANIAFGDLSFFKIDSDYKSKITLTDMMVPPITRRALLLPPSASDNPILSSVVVPAMVVHAEDNCASWKGKAPCKKSRDSLIKLQHAINNYNLLQTSSSYPSLQLMDKVGHFPQAEDPDTFNAILKNFLSQI